MTDEQRDTQGQLQRRQKRPPWVWRHLGLTISASLVGLHLLASGITYLNYRATVAAAREQGFDVVITPADLPPAVPATENAALALMQAAERLSDFSDAVQDVLTVAPADLATVDAAADEVKRARQAVIDQLIQMGQLPGCDWRAVEGAEPEVTIFESDHPLFPHQVRALAKVARSGAVLAAQQGDAATAVRQLEAGAEIPPVVYGRRGAFGGLLVGLDADAVTNAAIAEVLARVPAAQIQPRPPAALKRLQQQRLADAALREGLGFALRREATSDPLLTWHGPGGTPRGAFIIQLALAPGINLAASYHVEALAFIHQQFAASGWDRNAWSPAALPHSGDPTGFTIVDAFVPTPVATLHIAELAISAQAQRRLAATAIALKRFEAEQGRRPATLDELVPDYMKQLPTDPFGDGTAKICYVPADGAASDAVSSRARLYSRGPDGVDDRGTPKPPKEEDRPLDLLTTANLYDDPGFDIVLFLDLLPAP